MGRDPVPLWDQQGRGQHKASAITTPESALSLNQPPGLRAEGGTERSLNGLVSVGSHLQMLACTHILAA